MQIIRQTGKFLVAVVAMLAFSVTASAYEVQFLTGQGSESNALEDGNYELAIKRLERRTSNDSPDFDIQLTNLCTAYVVTGEFDKARGTCDRAIAEDGEFVGTAYNSRAVLNALTGDFIAALVDFEHAADKSNYPRPREYFGDQAPSMQRFSTPHADVEQSVELAAQNLHFADQRWAAIREESEDLTAGVR